MADFIHWGGLKSSESGGGGGVDLIDLMFPVGSVITNSRASFDPNTLYEGTRWERIKGRIVIGVDESDTMFNTVGKIGGHKKLQSHTHSGSTSSNGNHYHAGTAYSGGSHNHYNTLHTIGSETSTGVSMGSGSFADRVVVTKNAHDDGVIPTSYRGGHSHTLTTEYGGEHNHSFTTSSAGTGDGENMPPYITKYVWERTA